MTNNLRDIDIDFSTLDNKLDIRSAQQKVEQRKHNKLRNIETLPDENAITNMQFVKKYVNIFHEDQSLDPEFDELHDIDDDYEDSDDNVENGTEEWGIMCINCSKFVKGH